MSQIPLRFSGSNPVVGSSKKTTFQYKEYTVGYPTREIAILSLLFIPPDNCLTWKFLKFYNETSSMALSTTSFSRFLAIPFIRA